MQYFVGLDVALRSLALCIIDGDGEIVLEKALLCQVDDVTAQAFICVHNRANSLFKLGVR